jgi:hypothetical protein
VTTVTTTTTATNVTTVNGLAAGVITATSIAADAITDAKVASDVTIASVTGAVGSVTGAVGSVTGSVGSIATGGITSSSFATGAINAAAIATDAITSNEISATAVTKIQTGLATPTNITAGTITTVTNLTNLPAGVQTSITNIEADTNELQLDWANGGRLDVILDARSSQTSVDDLPTNAELTAALGTADDAVLAAIAAEALKTAAIQAVTDKISTGLVADGGVWQFTANMLELGPSGSGLDAAGVRAAIGLASANLDTQLAPLATGVELDSATTAKIDAMEAVIAGTVTGAGTTTEVFVGTDATVTVTVDVNGNRSAVVVS